MIQFNEDFADFGNDGEEEEGDMLPLKNTASKSRLASLFSGAKPAPPAPEHQTVNQSEAKEKQDSSSASSSTPTATLFTAAVHLFQLNDAGAFEPAGRAGLVILSRSGQSSLLLYSAEKRVIAQLPLISSTASHFSLAPPYLQLTDAAAKRWSLYFDDTSSLENLLLWLVLTTGRSSCSFDVSPGLEDGHPIEEGDSVLIDLHHCTLHDTQITGVEEKDVKFRISTKRNKNKWEPHVAGLRKGAVRLISGKVAGECTVVRVRKVKGPKHEVVRKKQVSARSSPPPPEDVAESSEAAPISEGTTSAEPEETSDKSDKHSEVLSRIARVGRPMLGLSHVVKHEEAHDKHKEDAQPLEEVAVTVEKDEEEVPVSVAHSDIANDQVADFSSTPSVSHPTVTSISSTVSSSHSAATVPNDQVAGVSAALESCDSTKYSIPTTVSTHSVVVPPAIAPRTVFSTGITVDPSTVSSSHSTVTVTEPTVPHPTVTSVPSNVSSSQSAVTVPEPTVSHPTVTSLPSTVPPSLTYEDLHRALGVEMDRLQARLENSLQRMLQPIRDELRRVGERQEELMRLLQEEKRLREDH